MNVVSQSGAFHFDDATHTYVLGSGLRAPSVTQILRRSGWVSFEGIQRDILENKRYLGSAVHACTQFYDEGDLDESTIQPSWVPYLDAWKKFRRECQADILGTEQRKIGQINGMPYGMTYDRLAIVSGDESLLEIKCSAQKSDWWGIQLAAYDLGLGQCKTQLHRKRYAVQLRPDGNYRLWPFEDKADYDAFTWALATTWLMLNRKYTID